MSVVVSPLKLSRPGLSSSPALAPHWSPDRRAGFFLASLNQFWGITNKLIMIPSPDPPRPLNKQNWNWNSSEILFRIRYLKFQMLLWCSMKQYHVFILDAVVGFTWCFFKIHISAWCDFKRQLYVYVSCILLVSRAVNRAGDVGLL